MAKRVRLVEIPRLSIHGRGGTDFVLPLQTASKLRPKPDVIIYFTDGDGRAPEQSPAGIEVIWCVVPSGYAYAHSSRRKPAEWGHTIFVERE